MSLRHRLLPSPMTSVALLLAWLMLNESASPGQWLLGALLADVVLAGGGLPGGAECSPLPARLAAIRSVEQRAMEGRKEGEREKKE